MMIPCNSGAACVCACMHITNPCPSSGPGPGPIRAIPLAHAAMPLCTHACSFWRPSAHVHEKRISIHNLGGNILRTACSEFCTLYVPERTVLLIRACKPMMPCHACCHAMHAMDATHACYHACHVCACNDAVYMYCARARVQTTTHYR